MFVKFEKEEVERSVPERFEKIVRKYPGHIAVKTGDEVVTYAELNTMANRLACFLLNERGSKPEPIGLLFEKGAPLLAGMLGVLKAGKFFVVIDPSFPKARSASLLEDLQASLVVTRRGNVSLVGQAASNALRVVEIESIRSDIPDVNVDLAISSNSLAIINYTSGSTGRPKGVIWTHRNWLHQNSSFTNAFHVCKHDKLILTTSGNGNAAAISFLALLNGATVVPFDVQKQGVTRLASFLSRERITICWFGTPLFRNLCETLSGEEKFPDVRVLRLASEAAYKTDLDLYKKYFSSGSILLNGLSTTEAGVLCLNLMDFGTEITGNELPVGYPVPDKEILLLDDEGNEVGFNAVGEIAVRSRYLSSGYWRLPELTNAKFKRDPRGGEKRIYLTGDLGLMLPDGCLIHKGRKDFRVKIRGYRVEIAEVQKVLRGHPALEDAVVVARENQSGEAFLVAYFTCLSAPGPSVSELRAFLSRQLPDYMIPSAFVALKMLPLTPSGKIDRHALPDPLGSRPALDTDYVAPSSMLQNSLTAIWTDLLGFEQVGIHDNFFDLGGHSLLATRVLARIHKEFRVEMPLSRFFETPTVAALADYIDRIGPSRDRTETFPIGTAEGAGNAPVSFAQQRLWFLDQLEPENSAYNLFTAFQLTGRLDLTALEQSFNEIIRRHQVLRTVFKSIDGQPCQIVLPSLQIKIPLVDLKDLASDEDRESGLRDLFRTEAHQPFDLARGPLLRVTLVELAEHRHVLLTAFHHIVFDGWSMGILARELSSLYEVFCAGRTSPLPELLTQYTDFARWQQNSPREETLKGHLTYWKKQLHKIEPLQLPTDRARLPVQTTRGGRQYFSLSRSLSAALKNLSRQHGATLFMTLLAAYQTLLHRYTAQDDIVIGAPVAGRNRSEVEGLIGFFLNMLVLRSDLSGNPTFLEVLAQVREVCVEAYAHQDLPFEKLVEELHPERNLSHNPLFQVTFTLQNTPTFSLNFSGLIANELDVDAGIARFDLHLFMEQVESGLRGWIDYNADLFDRATITRMIDHFHTLLEGIIANPENPIGSLALLSEAEKHRLLVEWSGTEKNYPRNKCVHQLFEEQVERTPEAIAVLFPSIASEPGADEQLTFRELNRRANRLARLLQTLGVGPDAPVGICMERSLEMVVGLLAILKASGAYVPLDPGYPDERIAFMLEDSGVRVVLTQERLMPILPSRDARIVCVDAPDRRGELEALEAEANPADSATADNLAYVIYTSGSTGRPKGVLITHYNVTRLLAATDSWFHFDQNDVWTMFHSYAFDFSVWEMWGALLRGGRLVVVPFWASRSPELFYKLLSRERVTVLNQTPSAFAQLIQFEQSSAIAHDLALRLVILGGEALDFQSLKPWFERHGAQHPRLVNMYGITETTVHVTHRPVTAADLPARGSFVGLPIPDLGLYVLDQKQNPAPIGVPGELCVGGAGIARGYLNRPELTAEKFMPDPFSDEPGARLYRTGDLARYLPNRDIEYLGRIDAQVKIRGYRIELGEIEAVLSRHPSVREAVALAREDSPGEKRLAAYIVPGDGAVQAGELRDFLKRKLPEYMVPSAFVFLGSLPLTPNGKVDRKALPAPDQGRPELGEGYVVPRTPREELLAKTWAEVLQLEKVGVHDNFFDLGGHSLLATQVISRLRDAFHVDLPLRALFEHPTVAGLAERIETLPWAGEEFRTAGKITGEREEIKL